MKPWVFPFPALDTLVEVREEETEVVIRATRDAFTPIRKEFFIKELIAEGFISERYRWSGCIRWLVDTGWLTLPQAALVRARRFMVRLMVTTTAVWVLSVGTALIQAQAR